MSCKFDVAIIGAGIAGALLAIACEKAKLNYTIYESGEQIWQHGSGIGFQPNAINSITAVEPKLAEALAKLYSQTEGQKADVLYKHGHDGRTWKAFDDILTLHTDGVKTIARSDIMKCMLEFIPTARFHFKKHLASLREGEKMQLHFRDGTTAEHDIVIGADGVHSHTRTYIGGGEDSVPRFTGKVVHRTVIKADDCRELVGHEGGALVMYVGYHGHVLMIPIDHNNSYSVTCFGSRQKWTDDAHWQIAATDVDLAKDYRTWDERIKRMLDKAGQTDVWAIFDLPYVQRFSRGSVAVTGDAAHASSPFQGNGAAIAFEDAYIMAALLQEARTVNEAKVALEVYDLFRRPRAQKQVQTALETGLIFEFEHHMVLDDMDAFRSKLASTNKWLWAFDVHAERERVLASMQERLRK